LAQAVNIGRALASAHARVCTSACISPQCAVNAAMPTSAQQNVMGSPEWMEVENFFNKKDRYYAKAYLEEQGQLEKFHEESRQGIHACRVEHAAGQHLEEQLTKHLGQVNNTFVENLYEYRHFRYKQETELQKTADEYVSKVRGCLAEENENTKKAQGYAVAVQNEICHLYNDLEQARQYRIQKNERLQEVVEDKLKEIHFAIRAERTIREESTHTLLDLFGEMGHKMQSEIDSVREERESSSHRMLQLMEKVLPNLETARLGHLKAVEEKLEDQKAAKALAHDAADKFCKRQTLAQKRATVVGSTQGHQKRMTVEQKVATF